ncbi:MAG: endonuclease domain-containing protein [Clostridia bacterium]|nr:endonuclease domain-containing protein [Clostridia bacterium]
MDRKHNSNIVPFAKELRKNMTKEERHLWYDFLKDYPIKFLRQKVLGKYIADFYCAKANIVIELDGSQHYEDDGIISDEKRTEYLEQYGIKVIRISNLDVLKNFEGVCMHIDNEVKQSLSQLC